MTGKLTNCRKLERQVIPANTLHYIINEDIPNSKAVSSEQMAVSKTKKSKNIEYSLLQFCQTPRSMSEICKHFALKDRFLLVTLPAKYKRVKEADAA